MLLSNSSQIDSGSQLNRFIGISAYHEYCFRISNRQLVELFCWEGRFSAQINTRQSCWFRFPTQQVVGIVPDSRYMLNWIPNSTCVSQIYSKLTCRYVSWRALNFPKWIICLSSSTLTMNVYRVRLDSKVSCCVHMCLVGLQTHYACWCGFPTPRGVRLVPNSRSILIWIPDSRCGSQLNNKLSWCVESIFQRIVCIPYRRLGSQLNMSVHLWWFVLFWDPKLILSLVCELMGASPTSNV